MVDWESDGDVSMAPGSGPERRFFPRGAVIFKEGGTPDVAFIVESGKVDILKSRDGKHIVLGSIPKWGIFGELALLDGKPRTASAIATEDTVCLVISRGSVSQLLGNAPRGLTALVHSMANTLRQSGKDLAEARLKLAETGPGMRN